LDRSSFSLFCICRRKKENEDPKSALRLLTAAASNGVIGEELLEAKEGLMTSSFSEVFSRSRMLPALREQSVCEPAAVLY